MSTITNNKVEYIHDCNTVLEVESYKRIYKSSSESAECVNQIQQFTLIAENTKKNHIHLRIMRNHKAPLTIAQWTF